MIEVQQLIKRYGKITALDNISFSIKQGEIVAFLGPNGAGKTTTMRIITGFMPPTSGTARIAGFDCLEHPMDVKRRIGYLPETPPLYLELTVHEYLTFVGRLKGLNPEQINTRMATIVQQTGLTDVQHRVIGHLSRGYRQRVGLAQALLHNPPVLILDEPTTGLDPNQILEIREVIKSLAGSHTIMLSTHVLAEATALCQRVIIIHQGKIVAVDTPEELSRKVRQSETLSITIKQDIPGLAEALSQVPGVLRVTIDSQPNTYLLDTEIGRDIREEVTKFLVRRDAGLLEIKSQPLTLENVFKALTQGQSGSA